MDQDDDTPPCYTCPLTELRSIESTNPMCIAAAGALDIFDLIQAGVTVSEGDLNWAEAVALKAIGREFQQMKAKAMEGALGG